MRNNKNFALLIAAVLFFAACNDKTADKSGDPKLTIGQSEKDFEKMAAEKGIAEAFWFFADSNAVIKRENDTLVYGKDAIRNYYGAEFFKTASIKWASDFISTSADGTMGYTYGKYTWQTKDSSGKLSEFKGIFHTVWKKQTDGSWKYVWD